MHVLDHFDAQAIRALCQSGEFFWLDLFAPSDEELDELAAIVGIPPLALEDTKEMGQRAKIDDYGDRLLIVFYGARSGGEGIGLVEVHVHLSPGRVITVRREPCTALDPVRTTHAHSDQEVVYRILDALSESVLNALREIETEVTRLEDAAFEQPSEADRRRIVDMRGRLFRLLQIIVPQRDMLDQGAEAIERVLGMGAGQAHHPFQDIRDDLVLAVNLIAYCRELLAEALNVQLASIFIPLTLVTGFFGQNFGWMVRHIDSLAAFLIFGIGGIVVPGGTIWLWLRRSGYLNRNGQ
jgi:magnesium transporter